MHQKYMQLIPLPHYFIVKINIEKQKDRKDKIGALYVHVSHTHMQRNLQEGEVVAIGSIASKKFPEAKIGDTLLIHHFVEGADSEKSNLIFSDTEYNYYNVTADEYNGHRNETYGIWDGEKVIPHPDFIFIAPEVKEKEISADEFIDRNTKQVGSLILFTNWEETREEREAKAQQITSEIKNMSKGKSMSDSTKRGLNEKQDEAGKITASLNKKEYRPYKVAFSHPKTKAKETVYALSLAAQLELEVKGKNYIVMQTKYLVLTA